MSSSKFCFGICLHYGLMSAKLWDCTLLGWNLLPQTEQILSYKSIIQNQWNTVGQTVAACTFYFIPCFTMSQNLIYRMLYKNSDLSYYDI